MTTPEAGRVELIAAILRGLKAYAPDEVEQYGRDEAEMIADYVGPFVAKKAAEAVRAEREACARIAEKWYELPDSEIDAADGGTAEKIIAYLIRARTPASGEEKKRTPEWLSQALNEGDGTYRP